MSSKYGGTINSFKFKFNRNNEQDADFVMQAKPKNHNVAWQDVLTRDISNLRTAPSDTRWTSVGGDEWSYSGEFEIPVNSSKDTEPFDFKIMLRTKDRSESLPINFKNQAGTDLGPIFTQDVPKKSSAVAAVSAAALSAAMEPNKDAFSAVVQIISYDKHYELIPRYNNSLQVVSENNACVFNGEIETLQNIASTDLCAKKSATQLAQAYQYNSATKECKRTRATVAVSADNTVDKTGYNKSNVIKEAQTLFNSANAANTICRRIT